MRLPSGKRLHNYGKSPFVMGKLTINGPFSIAMLVYQRVYITIYMHSSWFLLIWIYIDFEGQLIWIYHIYIPSNIWIYMGLYSIYDGQVSLLLFAFLPPPEQTWKVNWDWDHHHPVNILKRQIVQTTIKVYYLMYNWWHLSAYWNTHIYIYIHIYS